MGGRELKCKRIDDDNDVKFFREAQDETGVDYAARAHKNVHTTADGRD